MLVVQVRVPVAEGEALLEAVRSVRDRMREEAAPDVADGEARPVNEDSRARRSMIPRKRAAPPRRGRPAMIPRKRATLPRRRPRSTRPSPRRLHRLTRRPWSTRWSPWDATRSPAARPAGMARVGPSWSSTSMLRRSPPMRPGGARPPAGMRSARRPRDGWDATRASWPPPDATGGRCRSGAGPGRSPPTSAARSKRATVDVASRAATPATTPLKSRAQAAAARSRASSSIPPMASPAGTSSPPA